MLTKVLKKLPELLSTVSEHLLLLKLFNFTGSDAPEMRLEEDWTPRQKTFEVRLLCHIEAYPSAQVTIMIRLSP